MTSGDVYLRQFLLLLPLVIAASVGILAAGYAAYPWLAVVRSPSGNVEAGVYAHILALKIGGVLVFLGAVLPMVVSLPRIRSQRVGELATNGAYRISRHPMYLSNALIMFPGLGVMLNNWALAILLAGAGIAFYLPHIRLEEEHLVKQFGETYRTYQQHVGLILTWGSR